MNAKKRTFFQREAIKAAFFLAIVLLVFSSFRAFFRFKYPGGIYPLKKLYELEENAVDVLFLGTSHVFETFHTGILYDEFGVAAFDLGGAEQPIWNSYHYLVEALKTQTPKLVVLEGYYLPYSEPYAHHTCTVKNTFGLKPSLNQLANLRASVPPDKFWSYFFHFYNDHNRYDQDLSSEDFYPNQGLKLYEDWKGYLPDYETVYYSQPYALGLTDVMPLYSKTETYYRKIIELCQSRGVPLHIVIVPFYMTHEEQMKINRSAQIAQEYGVPFTDYNGPGMHELLGFDYSRDMALGNHLNAHAGIRFTRSFGEMLVSAYDLPDRRGDERYVSWARDAAYHRRDFDNQQFLREQTQLAPYLEHLAQDPDYTAILSVTGYLADYFDQITAWLAPFGIDDIYFTHDMNGTWASRGGEVLVRWSSDNRYPYVQLDDQTITLAQDHALAGRKPVRLTEKGLNIIVYDHVTQTIADTVGFDALSGFTAVRE